MNNSFECGGDTEGKQGGFLANIYVFFVGNFRGCSKVHIVVYLGGFCIVRQAADP